DLADIDDAVEFNLGRLAEALAATAEAVSPLIVSLPTLPLPPLFPQRPDQSGSPELQIRARLATLAASVAGNDRIRIASAPLPDWLSPLSAGRDLRAELSAGFPYSLDHACALATVASALIFPAAPKKGLITDLDGTLWSGIVGEVGADNVSWSLDDHCHRHAL